MNNAKVRIYDLSKELHLENREILEICDDLNIVYKSHSSTISEADAERIKSATEKYIAQRRPPRKSLPKPEQKQQILAIHHKQIQVPNPPPVPAPVIVNSPTPPKLSTPQPPVSPQLAPPEPPPPPPPPTAPCRIDKYAIFGRT